MYRGGVDQQAIQQPTTRVDKRGLVGQRAELVHERRAERGQARGQLGHGAGQRERRLKLPPRRRRRAGRRARSGWPRPLPRARPRWRGPIRRVLLSRTSSHLMGHAARRSFFCFGPEAD